MKVGRVLGLPPRDQALLARAGLLLALTRIGLWFMPFSRVQQLVARAARSGRDRRDADPRRIAWAVELAARSLAIDNCLSRALTGRTLLARAGLPATVRVGVAREGGTLVAHAWVESGDDVVIGDDELERYKEATGPGRIA